MNYVFAFIIGGIICLIGECLIHFLHFSPVQCTCTLVILGGVIYPLKFYRKLKELSVGGTSTPILSFGYTMTEGAIRGMREKGILGILSGSLESVSTGIVFAVLIAVLCGILFNTK